VNLFSFKKKCSFAPRKKKNERVSLLKMFFRSSACPGGQFTFRRAAFLTQLQSKVGLALAKAAALRININVDGEPIASKSHTHPSHS
jgi:hypothetical protein